MPVAPESAGVLSHEQVSPGLGACKAGTVQSIGSIFKEEFSADNLVWTLPCVSMKSDVTFLCLSFKYINTFNKRLWSVQAAVTH